MAVRAAYLEHAAHAERDELEYVPEFSRRGRAIPVYATLRHLGRQGVAALVERCCAHARLFAEVLAASRACRILNDVVLNQVLVRFGDSDELTRGGDRAGAARRHMLARRHHLAGQGAMRISVSNWSTAEDDVRRSADAILKAFRDLATSGREQDHDRPDQRCAGQRVRVTERLRHDGHDRAPADGAGAGRLAGAGARTQAPRGRAEDAYAGLGGISAIRTRSVADGRGRGRCDAGDAGHRLGHRLPRCRRHHPPSEGASVSRA